MLVVRKTIISGWLSSNTDEVVAWAPIPAEGKLLSVQGALHVIGAEETRLDRFGGYGVSAELIPLVDPDGGLSLDVFWDEMVSKTDPAVVAAATTEVDFDWDTVDSAPDVEPGEIDLAAMTGLVQHSKQIMAPHLEWLSFAKGPQSGFFRVDGGTDHYVPTSYKTFRASRTLVADKLPHIAMIALSAPAFDQEEVSHSLETSAGSWGILSNLDNVMDDFWRINAGLIESSAESPYAEISAQIENLVAPEIIMPSTATIVTSSFTFLCTATWLLDFPDESFPGVLKAD